MARAATRTRHNRTITVDFHDEATYVQLLSDGKAFVECVLAFLLALGFQLAHKVTCRGGGCLTRHSHYVVWSKNPNIALWQGLRTGPPPIFGLHTEPSIPHTQRQLKAEQVEGARPMDWKTFLAYLTGTVDQELLLHNEYVVTENRILRNQIQGRLRLSTGERTALAEIGQKLGKQALEQVATIVKPDTILAWHRKLVAQKFDGSQPRKTLGRPKIDQELEALVVRMAQENRAWGYDRMVGALANLGLTVSDQTVGNILKRHGIPPAPERKTTT